MIRLSGLILAVGLSVPGAAQESLDLVDSLALAGSADEARAELESWWENQRVGSSRLDRQRGLWLRAILTVDPRMAGLDFQRLVLEYPGGPYSDEAILRLGLISAAGDDLPRAAVYFRTLVTDYPRSPRRRQAQEWLADHVVAVEEAEAVEAEAVVAEAVVEPAVVTADRSEAREPEVEPADRAGTVSPRYAVQVGAFDSEERARSLLASINASGFRARMVRVTGSDLVRVRIGAFFDRTGAVELMDRVRRRGHEATLAEDAAEESPLL